MPLLEELLFSLRPLRALREISLTAFTGSRSRWILRDCRVALVCLTAPRNDNLPPYHRVSVSPRRAALSRSPRSHTPAPLRARAKVSTETSAPALRRIPAQALTVAPVV